MSLHLKYELFLFLQNFLKIKLGFKYNNFAKDIIKNSKVKLFMVDDQYQLAKFIKNTIFGKKIVVGMGAGTISTWMRQLPELI